MPRDFIGGLKIGPCGGVLDIMLAGRASGVHVDCNQRFRLVDNDIAAGFQRNLRREHRIELRFNSKFGENRRRFAVRLHILRMARHEHAHEVLGVLIGLFTRHNNFVDILVIQIADRAFNQRAFFIHQHRGCGLQRGFAHGFPCAHQIFKVALDFRLGPRRTGGAQNNPHAVRNLKLLSDGLQPLAVGNIGDFARNAAATSGIGHQHRITPGQ